jgi:hypothetical protein
MVIADFVPMLFAESRDFIGNRHSTHMDFALTRTKTIIDALHREVMIFHFFTSLYF